LYIRKQCKQNWKLFLAMIFDTIYPAIWR